MHVDAEAYIAIGFLVSILAVTGVLFGYLMTRKKP